MDDKLSIRINIAERYYSLKAEPDEEEGIRLAAKIIGEKLLSLKQKQPNKDMQDWLAMTCLWFAMKLAEAESKPDLDIAVNGIRSFENQIAEYLEYAAEKQ